MNPKEVIKMMKAEKAVAVDMKFNWVVLVNVLNAFLGVPIDILTGAWFNLSPGRIDLRLPPLGGA